MIVGHKNNITLLSKEYYVVKTKGTPSKKFILLIKVREENVKITYSAENILNKTGLNQYAIRALFVITEDLQAKRNP